MEVVYFGIKKTALALFSALDSREDLRLVRPLARTEASVADLCELGQSEGASKLSWRILEAVRLVNAVLRRLALRVGHGLEEGHNRAALPGRGAPLPFFSRRMHGIQNPGEEPLPGNGGAL